MKKLLTVGCLSLLLIFGYSLPVQAAACAVHSAFQDSSCTPGATLPVTAAQVCISGYSKSVRNVSQATKNAVFNEYGITSHPTGSYEVDHLISLELGGSNDLKNLWPEAANPTPGFHQKDVVENYLHKQVCNGTISLATAQHEIATNWLVVYSQMGGKTTSVAISHAATKVIKATKKQKSTVSATVSTAQPAVKKSLTGLCHAKGSRYYSQTKKFTPYASMAACVASGGKASS